MKLLFEGKLILTIWLLNMLLSFHGVASSHLTDSLKALAAKENDPQKKIALLHEISLAVSQIDFKEALHDVTLEYKYAKQINNKSAVVEALILKGRLFSYLQLNDSAMDCYETAFKIASEMNDSIHIAKIYNQKGDVFKDRNDVPMAIEYYNKSYSINVQIKNYKGQLENLNRISMVYFDQNRIEDAFKKDIEIYELATKLGDEVALAQVHGSLGNIYYMKNEFDSALSYYLKSLPYYEKKGGLRLSGLYSNIGDVYVEKKQFDKALEYFNKSLPLIEQLGNEASLAHLYISIGRSYALSKMYDKAKPYFEKGEMLSKSFLNYELLAEVYGLTADMYAAQNDFKKAFEYQLKVEAAKDSLNNVTRNEKVLELQTRFETFKHEKENALLKVENDMAKSKVESQKFSIIALSVATILITLIGLLIYRLFRLRTKKLKSEQTLNSKLELQTLNIERLNNMLEIRAIRAQMDPHFIFNCLASVQHLITTEKTADAERYIVKFSRLLRMVLENAEQNTVSLDKEIEMLKLYLDLESIRMNENFKYEINVDEALLDENIKVPTLVIQPFAENAIWHGLAEKTENRVLLINIEAHNNVLKCVIEDNGIGRKKSAEKNRKKDHESKAVKMIIERLKIIKQQTKVDATGIETVDLFDEQHQPAGTKVIIQLPVIVRA